MKLNELYAINRHYTLKRIELLLIMVSNICTLTFVVLSSVIVSVELSVVVSLLLSFGTLSKTRFALASVKTLSLLLCVSFIILAITLASPKTY